MIAASGSARAAPEISIGPDLPLGFQGGTTFFPGGLPGEQQFGTFNISNTGTARLTVTGMAITGPGAATMAFLVSELLCVGGQVCAQKFSLEPGQSRAIPTTCTAPAAGVFAASFTVTSNVAGHYTTVAMECLGNHPPAVTVSPPDGLDFGVMHHCFPGDLCGPSCATRPTIQTLTITNSAPAPSELAFFLEGAFEIGPFGDFTVTPPQGFDGNPLAVRAGESTTIEFRFHARSVLFDGPLRLVSLFPGQPAVEIPFRAHSGGGHAVIDTPGFLGTAEYGKTFVTTITGHNAGTSCLFLTSLSLSGMCEPIGDNPLPLMLAPGDSFARTAACTPKPENLASADLLVEAPFEGLDIQVFFFHVAATGGALRSSSPGIEFIGPRQVPVGSSSTVRIHVNNAGNDPTDLVALTSGDPQFTAALVTGSLPLTVSPVDFVPIDVTFTPTSAGRASSTITFAASPGMSLVLPVLGDGVIGQAGVTISTRQLAIGDADDPVIAAAGIERARSGGCQTGGAGGLALIAGAAGLLVRQRRRAGFATSR